MASLPEIRIICTTSLPFSLLVRYPHVRRIRLGQILQAEGQLQPLVAKARDIRALAGLVAGFLPPDLAPQARVANFKDGELVLFAANPAAAAKLRLLAPSLSRSLTGRWQVNSVSVRVQPSASRIAASQKTAYFSTNTLDTLKQLYEGMKPSPAREALRRLLERRGVMPPAEAPLRRTEPARKPGRKRST